MVDWVMKMSCRRNINNNEAEVIRLGISIPKHLHGFNRIHVDKNKMPDKKYYSAINFLRNNKYIRCVKTKTMSKSAYIVTSYGREAYSNYVNNQRVIAMQAAINRQVENIERWLETGIPADKIESESIYNQLKKSLE